MLVKITFKRENVENLDSVPFECGFFAICDTFPNMQDLDGKFVFNYTCNSILNKILHVVDNTVSREGLMMRSKSILENEYRYTITIKRILTVALGV